jgi:hypothetical protein|eukprot:SAG25_NODE_134_length_14400_cov_805.311049_12_plen_89_part_00
MPAATAPSTQALFNSDFMAVSQLASQPASQSGLLSAVAGSSVTRACVRACVLRQVEVVCSAVEAREAIPKLYKLGARGILTYPLNTVI